jgi:hypothetical protein
MKNEVKSMIGFTKLICFIMQLPKMSRHYVGARYFFDE